MHALQRRAAAARSCVLLYSSAGLPARQAAQGSSSAGGCTRRRERARGNAAGLGVLLADQLVEVRLDLGLLGGLAREEGGLDRGHA